MSTGRVVTFGEVLLRLSPPGAERLFQSPSLRTWWGGAEANVATGLAHLGTASRHVSVLPSGSIGDAAVRALRAEGVDTTAIVRRPGRMGLYFLESGADLRPLHVTYDRAHSAFAQLSPADFDWTTLLRDVSWLHLSGISPSLGDGPLQAVHAALAAASSLRVPVSLDLNYRPALWVDRDPIPVLQPIAAHAQLMVANPGAIKSMLGITTDGFAPETPHALRNTVQRVHEAYGCARVAITQREVLSSSVHAWQAYLWESSTGNLHHGGRHVVQVVDRVGGGDSFVAALLHMLMQDAPAASAVRFATAASALKLTIPGDVNRVTAADVHQLLAKGA